MIGEKVKRQIDVVRKLVEKGLVLLGDGATYFDLVEVGFIPREIPEKVGKNILASIRGIETGERKVTVQFDEKRFGTENF